MVRIAITQGAFDAIAKTLALGSVGFENKTDEHGNRQSASSAARLLQSPRVAIIVLLRLDVGLFRVSRDHRRVDKSWVDGIDTNPEAREFEGGRSLSSRVRPICWRRRRTGLEWRASPRPKRC
jgi:hypothetical protein